MLLCRLVMKTMSGKPKRKRRSITKIKPGEKARKTGCVCKHCQLQFKQDADLGTSELVLFIKA